MIQILMLMSGVFLIGVGARILLILNRSKKTETEAILKRESGIFIEHGMVRAQNRIGVEADKKLSDVYYNSVA